MVVVEAINISHYLIFTLITWNVTYYLEMTLENTLDSKEIKAVNSKGNQPWIFTGRTDAEADALIFWPPDVKSQFIRKDPNAGKDWRQEEKWSTEDEIVGWHQWLKWQEFEQTLRGSEGQGSLACCSPWDCKESDITEWLNSNKGQDVNLLTHKFFFSLPISCLCLLHRPGMGTWFLGGGHWRAFSVTFLWDDIFKKLILLMCSWLKVLCSFLVHSKVIQLCIYILFFISYAIMVYHRILNIVPCAM